ncbi:MAG: alpha/beta hydrolase [Sedimentitalea sp.]|nr:alpha/beta hydrolase [Sedimentitalea sp.]
MKDAHGPAQKIATRHFGQGPRRVLALHCTIAHAGAWRGLAGLLKDEARVLAPDMLSHGRSPDWDGQGDFQDREVEAVAPLLTEPMDLIGHSFGATIALRLAVEHPDLVRSLALIEPVFLAVAKQDAPELVAAHDREAAPIWEAYEAGDHALAARLFNRMWSSGPRWPDLPEATRAAMTRGIRVVPACDASVFQDKAGLLRPGVLDAAAMPVLLLRGSLTQPVIAAVNEGLARRLPDARSEVIEGAGHMLPISHPEATAAAIRRLWARGAV